MNIYTNIFINIATVKEACFRGRERIWQMCFKDLEYMCSFIFLIKCWERLLYLTFAPNLPHLICL